MTIAGLVLAALMLTSGVSLLRPACPVAVLSAALSAAWLSVNNGLLEGPILLTLSKNHGVTVADLVSVAGAGLAVVTVLRWRRNAHLPDRTGTGSERGFGGPTRDWVALASLAAIVVIMLGGVALNVAYQ